MTGDVALLPVLCVALLPAWLIVTGRPLMQIVPPRVVPPATPPPAAPPPAAPVADAP